MTGLLFSRSSDTSLTKVSTPIVFGIGEGDALLGDVKKPFACVACLLFAAVSTVSAIQLWPDLTFDLSAEDRSFDRGADISEHVGYNAALSVNFDLISVDVHAGLRDGGSDPFEVEQQFGYTLSYCLSEGKTMLIAGVDGAIFDGASALADIERHELFFEVRQELRSLPRTRISWQTLSDMNNDFAAYSFLSLEHTVPLWEVMDMECALKSGIGDERFSASQLQRLGAEAGSQQLWSDLSVSVALPIVIGNMDLVPRVSHSWVLDGDLRDAIDAAGKDAEGWQFVVAVRLYLE